MVDYDKIVLQGNSHILGALLKCLSEYSDLWKAYFDQVVKKLYCKEIDQNRFLLKKYIGPFVDLHEQECSVVGHLVRFHTHLYVHKMAILKVQRALQPITYIETTGNTKLHGEGLPNFSAYIIMELSAFLSSQNPQDMEKWLRCYHSIVSLVQTLLLS